MNGQTIGFIGGGRVTRILAGGWKRAGLSLANVVVHDPNADAVAALARLHPELRAGDLREAAACSILFLAVHPPAMGAALGGLAGALSADTLVVSLAPKFTLAKLAEALGGHRLLARVIPNAPSLLGAGYNPVTFADGLDPSVRSNLRTLLEPLGEAPEVAEAKLEAYALLTAMGPTYLWFQLQALRELAVAFGLDEAEVTPALKRMVCGSTRTLLESGLSAADVMDLVPVKPLAEDQPAIEAAYRNRLPALFAKIKP